ncbi:MAG: conserved membrane protein of unknown function [Promethearchaeota archaeon]|nr:MAG: conserved membrane protein of unknown function [Candidatus Lokiarchaeota archaeon]
MKKLQRILTTLSSIISIGFGVWHFFVPILWDWYSYIDQEATELIVAVRAINVFFSLSLVLFGVINIILINHKKTERFTLLIILSATSILWSIRVIMQIFYPQGSLNTALQYSMLFTFILVLSGYFISLIILLFYKQNH